MKLKFLFPFLLLTATDVSAQQWSVGLNAGAMCNTKMESLDGYKSPGINPALSLDVAYVIHSKWQAGVSLDYQRPTSKFDDDVLVTDPNNPNGGIITEHLKFNFYRPAYSFVGRFARLFNTKKIRYSAGISAGYYRMYDNYNSDATGDKLLGNHFLTDGFRMGVQGGARYTLSHHWALNATLNGDYFFYNNPDMLSNKKLITSSLNIGIVYLF